MLLSRTVHEADMKKFIEIQGEHVDCVEKISMFQEELHLNLKVVDDVHNELGEFVVKVHELEKKMKEDLTSTAT